MQGVTGSRSIQFLKISVPGNCVAPFFLILHNSGCRRIKIRPFLWSGFLKHFKDLTSTLSLQLAQQSSTWDTERSKQGFGSVRNSFDTEPDPAFQAEYRSGSRVLMTNKFTAVKNFVGSKTTIYLSLGLHKGRLSYRRSLQLSKENIQHFKTIS